ncbi:MAG: glycosyltransferase family 2 protein [Cyclobacteriaceae bacterium]
MADKINLNLLTGSIIIPTYNGARKIHHLMDCLLKQSFSNTEIIIVIDGSTDDTEEVLEPYRVQFKNLKIIKQINSGRSIVRNNGARASIGEVLIFYDDDMMPFPDSVENHMKFHAANRGILCGHQIEDLEIGKTDIQNYKAWISKTWLDKYPGGVNLLKIDNLFFTASNCSFSKDVFLKLNGFNDTLSDCEDYDIALRAIQAGIPAFFDKGNRAIHDDKITCVSYISRLREYGREQKKIQLSYGAPAVKRRNYAFIKGLVYKAFAYRVWAQLIDKGFFTFVYPKRLRYRLYSTIIQSLANEHSTVPL